MQPRKKFKCGAIAASIWSQDRTVNGRPITSYSITIDRAYLDGDEWRHSTSFAVEDLPKISVVAIEAYKFIRLRSSENDDQREEV
jgi:hypothetical protein